MLVYICKPPSYEDEARGTGWPPLQCFNTKWLCYSDNVHNFYFARQGEVWLINLDNIKTASHFTLIQIDKNVNHVSDEQMSFSSLNNTN